MTDGDHHGRGGHCDWRRSRSESSGPLGDDMDASYVAGGYLPGHHRRRYVNNSFYSNTFYSAHTQKRENFYSCLY